MTCRFNIMRRGLDDEVLRAFGIDGRAGARPQPLA